MHNQIHSENFKKGIINAGLVLGQNRELVDSLNVFPVPDGDTGTNMSKTMDAAVEYIKKSNAIFIGEMAQDVSKGSLMGARGNSGVILSQIFRGFSKGLKDVTEHMNCGQLAEAFHMASQTAYNAVMKPTEGTILTVVREMAEFAMERYSHFDDIVLFLEEIIKEGEQSVLRTPELLPVLKEANVVDAGGKGLILIFRGFLNAIKGIDEVPVERYDFVSPTQEKTKEAPLNLEYLYCTGFILNTNKINGKQFGEEISYLGDSMVIAEAEDLIKVHIHSNQPGEVLQIAVKYGELTDINIDNMKYQHDENSDKIEKAIELEDKVEIVAVSMGSGITSLFEELGVSHVINGGQTMNPSTEDFVKVIERSQADKIIILPNNSNIVLAAKQAADILEREVYVVESKTVPQGIAAMLSYDNEMTVQENVSNMQEATQLIKTGQVTYAVRNTNMNGLEIKENDIIGLCGKEILEVGSDISTVTFQFIEKLLDEESDIVTLYYGEGVSQEEGESLIERLEEKYDTLEFELVEGNQPIYYYLISVE